MNAKESATFRYRSNRKRQAWGLPWFRNHDGWWYVKLPGSHRPEKLVKGEDNRLLAVAEWQKRLAIGQAVDTRAATPVWVIFELFLEAKHKENVVCYRNYRDAFQDFKNANPQLMVNQLSPSVINEWLASHPGWGDSTKANNLAAVLAALNWAAMPVQNILDRNPIRGIKKPRARSRGEESVVDEGDLKIILEAASPPVRDAILFLRYTGTRPGNLSRITAQSVDWENRRIALDMHKTKAKTGRSIFLPITAGAEPILRRLSEKNPTGPLFLTAFGNVMTGKRISESIDKIKRTLKKKGILLRGNFIAYGLRHTFATRLFGVIEDSELVFALGHKDTRMLYHHYGHMETKSKLVAERIDLAFNQDGDAPVSGTPSSRDASEA